MDVNGEFIITLVVTVGAIAGLLWRLETRISGVETRLETRISGVEARLETRISGVETRLGDRISEVSDRVSRIEGLLEGYFMQESKKDANDGGKRDTGNE